MTLFLFVLIATLCAVVFAAVSTKRMIPTLALTWDRRVLTPNQVYNRETLRMVTHQLLGWLPDRTSARNTLKRWVIMGALGLSGFILGYDIAAVVHAVVLIIRWAL